MLIYSLMYYEKKLILPFILCNHFWSGHGAVVVSKYKIIIEKLW